MNRIRTSAAVAALAAACTIFFAGCGKRPAAAAAGTAEEETVYAVSSYKIGTGNLDEYLEFGGDVASVNAIDVLPDMAGKISRVLVGVGDSVRKDQTIAYVDASRAGMYYTASPITSPISGRVTSLPITIGSTVSQATAVAKVSRTDELEIKINVAERFISRISDKQGAVITFDAYPGVEFGATVFEVSPVLDTSTRTMQVKLRFNEADPRIKVGMYARVRLVTDSVKNAVIIPATAIVTKENRPYVYVIAQGRGAATARLQQITQGLSVDNRTEVTAGVEAGDEIVIKGQTLLTDGAKVNIISVQQD